VVLQIPLVIVQPKTYDPNKEAVAVARGSLTSLNVTVPGPDTFAQVPVPADVALAASVAERTLQRFWSGPASAASANDIVTLSEVLQVPFVIVHFST
jgi:hypothetical protein